MHSKTLIIDSTPTTTTNHDHDHDHDLDINGSGLNSDFPADTSDDHDTGDNPQFPDEFEHQQINSDSEPDAGTGGVSDNNPPDSFWVSNNRVTDWLNHHTFIERKASVKLVASSRNFETNQNRSSQRSVSFSHKPQTTIIGFRQKPAHSSDGKSRQNERQDNIRLFKNRSVPGKGTGLPVNEPRSPRVSCIGRVGSMRGRARRSGFWKNVKTAILNRVRTSKKGR